MSKTPRWVWLALAAASLWHIALRQHGLSLPLISDEGEYAYEARLLIQGGLPYRDAFCQKPPMIFFLYRLAYAFSRHPDSPRLLALGFSLATMALLWLLAPASWGWTARLAAPAAYGALSTYPAGALGFAANTEVFLTAFLALSAWLVKRSWGPAGPRAALLAGAAAGAALMTKPTCAWTAAAFAALAFSGENRRRKLASYGAGACLAPAFFAAYFAARGGFAAFWADAFGRNLAYASIVLRTGALRSQFGWFAGTLVALLLKGSWPAWALAGLGLFARNVGRERDETLIAAWLATALAGAMTGLFFFPHYFLPAFAPLALAAGLGVERLSARRGGWAAAALLVAAMTPAAAFPKIYFHDPPEAVAKELLYPNPLYESYPLGLYIRRHSKPSDTMYVFGSEPQLYVYAQRAAATENIFSYPLTLFPRDAASVDAELAKLSSSEPLFIVYSNQPASTLISSALGERFRDGVRALLARRYSFVATAQVPPEPSFIHGMIPASFMPADFSSSTSLLLFERKDAAGSLR